MGVLSGLKGAAPNLKTPFFLVGLYRVQIEEVKLHNGNAGEVSFIIRAKITRSNVESRPVGMVCSQVIKITGNKSALGNIKAFVAACLELDTNDSEAMASIDEALVESVIADKALNGFVMDLECVNIKTKEKGNDFTVHNWRLAKDGK